MADVSSNLYSWSTTASSNSPSGATNVGSGLDDNLRQLQATVREGLAHYNSVAVASAGSVDLGAQTGNFLIISHAASTTAISAFGTVSAGIWKVVRFSISGGTLSLTHNATSLILPGAANITLVSGDVACFLSEGSGNWRCVWFEPTDGRVRDASFLIVDNSDPTKKIAFQASGITTATTRTLTAPDASTTIVGTDATQTLTNKTLTSPTLTTPTINGAAAGTTWSGHVLQVVNGLTTAYDSTTNTIPVDDTVPQQGGSEGKEFMTKAITPTNASNKLKIEVVAVLSHTVDTATMVLALFQDATASALSAALETVSAAGGLVTMKLTYYMTAGTTSETTFKVRGGSGTAGTTGFNGAGGGRLMGGVAASSITITEIKV
jgi:hypothetical protein